MMENICKNVLIRLKAKLILIIKSKDNKIIELEYNKDNPKQYEKTISKREVAFVKNKTQFFCKLSKLHRNKWDFVGNSLAH